MEDSALVIRLSKKSKTAFLAMCKDREISMSDAVRDFITNSVRNYKRPAGKKANEVS